MSENKKIIIGAIISILFLGGLIFVSNSSPTPAKENNETASGKISAEEASYDFGTISMAAGKVSHVFKIKNSTTESAKISKIYTSCMCTEAKLTTGDGIKGPFGMPGHISVPTINVPLAPGEEAAVEVIFDPNAHGPAGVGKMDRTVTLETNSGNVDLKFKVTVTP
jgi:hypothetical protein